MGGTWVFAAGTLVSLETLSATDWEGAVQGPLATVSPEAAVSSGWGDDFTMPGPTALSPLGPSQWTGGHGQAGGNSDPEDSVIGRTTLPGAGVHLQSKNHLF